MKLNYADAQFIGCKVQDLVDSMNDGSDLEGTSGSRRYFNSLIDSACALIGVIDSIVAKHPELLPSDVKRKSVELSKVCRNLGNPSNVRESVSDVDRILSGESVRDVLC